MSGSTDTSTPQQRQAFVALIEGSGGVELPVVAAAVASCPLPLPETSAFLLDLPAGASFAQGAARLQQRWAAGRAGM